VKLKELRAAEAPLVIGLILYQVCCMLKVVHAENAAGHMRLVV
jgi:hypothetical protein